MSSLDRRIARIQADIDAIAQFSESPPEVGYDRPTFSPAWAHARDYVIAEAAAAGATHTVDPAGNIHICHPRHDTASSVWLSGSHVDSVPSGGRFDGVIGVVVPLEILRSRPDIPLELVIFAEEEGTTFGLGLLGSRAWVGDLGSQELATLSNQHGKTYLEAGAPYGVDQASLDLWEARIDRYAGFVEVHAEQGRALWDNDEPLAVVSLINGRRQYAVSVRGQENHAGSTAMVGRRDALAGSAEMLVALEALALELGNHTVITVGSIDAQPNSVNVIAGNVTFTIDFRAPDDQTLKRGDEKIHTTIEMIASRRNLAQTIKTVEEITPMPLDTGIVDALASAASRLDQPVGTMGSGALHDAAIVARRIPTAMLFVASRDGISHNPDEYSRVEDIALAAQVIEEALDELGRKGGKD